MATIHEYLDSITTTSIELAKAVSRLDPNGVITEAQADDLYDTINDIESDLKHVTRFIDARVERGR